MTNIEDKALDPIRNLINQKYEEGYVQGRSEGFMQAIQFLTNRFAIIDKGQFLHWAEGVVMTVKGMPQAIDSQALQQELYNMLFAATQEDFEEPEYEELDYEEEEPGEYEEEHEEEPVADFSSLPTVPMFETPDKKEDVPSDDMEPVVVRQKAPVKRKSAPKKPVAKKNPAPQKNTAPKKPVAKKAPAKKKSAQPVAAAPPQARKGVGRKSVTTPPGPVDFQGRPINVSVHTPPGALPPHERAKAHADIDNKVEALAKRGAHNDVNW